MARTSNPSSDVDLLRDNAHSADNHRCKGNKKAQLSLRKADRTAHVRSPESDFQSRVESNLSEMTQLPARYVNRTLLSKATINASITDVARGHFARRYKELQS